MQLIQAARVFLFRVTFQVRANCKLVGWPLSSAQASVLTQEGGQCLTVSLSVRRGTDQSRVCSKKSF